MPFLDFPFLIIEESFLQPFKKTSSEDAQRFFEILLQRGINATLRMEHGSDISAACGQLRAKKILEENNE